jgi:hypothetical protein
MTEHIDQTPALGLWNYAWEYAEAARQVAGEPELRNVAYFLICHSIELALKAFLRTKGWEARQLKTLGHNLEAALKEAERVGLKEVCPFEWNFECCLRLLNVQYEAKDFEYIRVAPTLHSFTFQQVMNLVLVGTEDLLSNIHPLILDEEASK